MYSDSNVYPRQATTNPPPWTMSWRKLNLLFQEVPVVPHSSSLPDNPPAQTDMDCRPATLLMNYSTWDLRVKRKRFNSEPEAKPATGLGSESPLGWGGCAESTPDGKPSFQQDTVMGGAAYAPSMKPFTPDFQTNSGPSPACTPCLSGSLSLLTSTWLKLLCHYRNKVPSPHCCSSPNGDLTSCSRTVRPTWTLQEGSDPSHMQYCPVSPSAKPRPSAEWTTLQ